MVSPVRTGLVPLWPELRSLFARAGLLTRKVMQGAAIADLPVERPIDVTMPTFAAASCRRGRRIGQCLLLADFVAKVGCCRWAVGHFVEGAAGFDRQP